MPDTPLPGAGESPLPAHCGRSAVESAALTVADVLNRVVAGLGDGAAAYRNPDAIGAGAYGQRAADWVYWYDGENSAYTPYDDPMGAINRGLQAAFNGFSMQGGDTI